MQTQWTCGFQASQYWKIALLVISVFIVFRVFTLPLNTPGIYNKDLSDDDKGIIKRHG